MIINPHLSNENSNIQFWPVGQEASWKQNHLPLLQCKLVLRAYKFDVSEPEKTYPQSSPNQDLLTLLLFRAKEDNYVNSLLTIL